MLTLNKNIPYLVWLRVFTWGDKWIWVIMERHPLLNIIVIILRAPRADKWHNKHWPVTCVTDKWIESNYFPAKYHWYFPFKKSFLMKRSEHLSSITLLCLVESKKGESTFLHFLWTLLTKKLHFWHFPVFPVLPMGVICQNCYESKWFCFYKTNSH